MGSAGIVEPVGNLGDGELVVDEQFLDALNLLQDAVALYGDAAVGGEEGAEGGVVGVQAVREEVGEILLAHEVRIGYIGDDGGADLVDGARPPVADEFKPEKRKLLLYLCRLVGRQVVGKDHFAQLNAPRGEIEAFKELFDHHLAAVAHHVLNVDDVAGHKPEDLKGS